MYPCRKAFVATITVITMSVSVAYVQGARTRPSSTQAASGTLPLGALVHDGPATPEQISLLLPVTGSLPQTASASVRYKTSSSPTWTTGHPLFRIQPSFSASPDVGSVPDAFAWPIIDLVPGTSYDLEVSVTSGSITDTRTASFTTRALPVSAGAPNKTIDAGSSTATIQAAFDALNPGDVIQFQNGTYNIDNLQLRRNGTLSSPIIIRGASRTEVVLSDPTGSVLQIQAASNVVIENLTLRGSNVDSGTDASSQGIEFYSGSPTQTRVTIRNLTIQGVDVGIKAYHEISEFLVYDNTLIGNNSWTSPMIDTNLTWNDDGINIPGFGNCAFNNSLKGFGDSLAYETSELSTQSIGVHFYRNDIRNSGDDMAEADGTFRNNTLYDNRSHNSMTFLSLDPLFGGPFVAARNIVINTGRSPYKFNNQNTGQFVYNNTVIRTDGSGSGVGWGWVQFNNGAQRSWGYQNNILIYQGSGELMANEAGSNNPIDFTHNSWFPNASVWWTNSGGTFASLSAAYRALPATTPVFSGLNKRHQQDNITVKNPWTTAITLGRSHLAEVTQTYTPVLASKTRPKNSGTVIPNITDGFSGTAPDRGAIIGGRSIPVYGDRSSTLHHQGEN